MQSDIAIEHDHSCCLERERPQLQPQSIVSKAELARQPSGAALFNVGVSLSLPLGLRSVVIVSLGLAAVGCI
jgi:hypothetical protein